MKFNKRFYKNHEYGKEKMSNDKSSRKKMIKVFPMVKKLNALTVVV